MAQAAARARPLRRVDVDHRLLGLVVHGIGEQPIGSTLKHVVNEFLPLIRARLDPEASVAAKPLDEGDPAEAYIWFRVRKREEGQEKGESYELRFFEVWWARAFLPPSFGEFVLGLPTFISTWLKRPDRRTRLWPERRYWGWSLWQRFVVDMAICLLLPVLVPLMLVLWLSESIGPQRFLPRWLLAAHRWLINIATRHLGDMWVYMRHPWEASRIRVRFEERFYQMINLIDGDAEKDKVDSVFVIAHSMGSVVAYEALTGRRITALIEERFPAKGRPTFHFISVGSALNSAWDFVPDSEKFRFYREFAPPVRWLNLWSGADPVPRGPLRLPAISDPDWKRGGPASFEDLDVVNQMDIFSDHSAYWNNAEQVIASILNAITSRRLGAALQMDTEARKRRVNRLAFLKALVWLVGPAVFVPLLLTGGQGISDWAAQGFLGNETLRRHFLSPVLWAAVAAIGAVCVYSTVVKWAWDFWDRKVKYRPPSTALELTPPAECAR